MLKKYKIIIIVGAGVIIAIAAIIFVREARPLVTPPAPRLEIPAPISTSQPKIKALIEIRLLSKNGKIIKISVHWENLPEGTTALDIFRSLSQTDIGKLVKTLAIDANSLAGGDAVVTLSGGQGSYFYGSALSNNGTPLWTSSSTEPITVSSTQQSSPNAPPPAPLPPPQPPANNPPNTAPSSSQPSPNSASSGVPYIIYYTPEGQISGSSTAETANFWVQHVDQKIQIGWQNIPSDTDRLIVSRSESADGPWTAMLTQKNPVTDGPYSLQIIDNTLNDSYYYKLDVYHGSTLTSSYGPILLGPI